VVLICSDQRHNKCAFIKELIIHRNLNADNPDSTRIPVTENCDCKSLDFFNVKCEGRNKK